MTICPTRTKNALDKRLASGMTLDEIADDICDGVGDPREKAIRLIKQFYGKDYLISHAKELEFQPHPPKKVSKKFDTPTPKGIQKVEPKNLGSKTPVPENKASEIYIIGSKIKNEDNPWFIYCLDCNNDSWSHTPDNVECPHCKSHNTRYNNIHDLPCYLDTPAPEIVTPEAPIEPVKDVPMDVYIPAPEPEQPAEPDIYDQMINAWCNIQSHDVNKIIKINRAKIKQILQIGENDRNILYNVIHIFGKWDEDKVKADKKAAKLADKAKAKADKAKAKEQEKVEKAKANERDGKTGTCNKCHMPFWLKEHKNICPLCGEKFTPVCTSCVDWDKDDQS